VDIIALVDIFLVIISVP